MKKPALIIAAAALALSAPAAFAADHEGHDHGSMDMDHGDHSMMAMGKQPMRRLSTASRRPSVSSTYSKR